MSLLTLSRRYRHPLSSSDGRIAYYNFWNKQPADEIWFTSFVQKRGFLNRYPKAHFIFFSTFGSTRLLPTDIMVHPLSQKRKRIFFAGENVHHPHFAPYQYNLLDLKGIDLSLGFDHIDDPRYLRFPLWLLEMFPPESSEKDIRAICDRLSHQALAANRNRFCALVSGNRGPKDPGAIFRTDIVAQLDRIAHVDCAGRLLNNTNELKTRFADNKAEFLKQYRFYVCPENASVEGYVTEKLFHCIGSGCIPIYWGAAGNPEPDILNHNAILFWNNEGDNTALLRQIEELNNNPSLYKDFFEQPRLQPGAWQVVARHFSNLEDRLRQICS